MLRNMKMLDYNNFFFGYGFFCVSSYRIKKGCGAVICVGENYKKICFLCFKTDELNFRRTNYDIIDFQLFS